MNILLKPLSINLVIGVLAIVLGGAGPVMAIIANGAIGCGDALGFAILAGGVVFLWTTHLIDKSNLNRKNLYYWAALVLSFFIMLGGQFIVQSFYGTVGQFDMCSMFVG